MRHRARRLLLLMAASIGTGCYATARGIPADDPSQLGVRRAWPIMGTMLIVTAYGRDSSALLTAIQSARDSVRLADSLMSGFRPTSEISALNAAAGETGVQVSPQTLTVLRQARVYWRLSEGAFDPTVGPLTQAWRATLDSGRVPSRSAIDSLRALVGFGWVEIDEAASVVRLRRRGMQLDVGGIAKGYALDMARAAFNGADVTGGTIDLGGNILFFGNPPRGRSWPVGIVDPSHRDRTIAQFWLDSGAVATSGNYERTTVIAGVRYSHIVDPRTGYPVQSGLASATAIAPTGLWTDGMSATLFLKGSVRGAQLIDSIAEMGGVFITTDGVVTLSGTARGRIRSGPGSSPPQTPRSAPQRQPYEEFARASK